MKLDTNLYTGKPPSLEEGPMRYQQTDAVIVKRVEARSHCQRCIQVLKVILYVELILFVGWAGCIFLATYYGEPPTKYADVAIRDESPAWTDDSSDESPSADITSSASNDPPKNIPTWLLDYGTIIGNEPVQHRPEVITDNNDDLIGIEMSTKATSYETEISDIDVPLTEWVNVMSNAKMRNVGGLWDDFSSTSSDSDEDKVTATDDSEQDEPFQSFNERWKKIMANIDGDSDESYASKSQFDTSPFFTAPFPNNPDDMSNEDSLEKMIDSLIDIVRMPYHPIFFSTSDVSDSAWDDFQRDVSLLNDEDSEFNDKGLSRNVRQIAKTADSDSNSSSDETTTPAPKAKRSAESSSDESGENNDKSLSSESSSSEENVEKLVRKIPSKCPKILDENGTPIEDPKKIVEHIKKNWFKSLLETKIPDCGGPDAAKNVTLDECGKFVIVCALPKIENDPNQNNGVTENVPEAISTK